MNDIDQTLKEYWEAKAAFKAKIKEKICPICGQPFERLYLDGYDVRAFPCKDLMGWGRIKDFEA